MSNVTDTDALIGRRIHELRDRLGLPQAKFAQILRERGFRSYDSTISRIETGKRPLHLSEAMVLCQALDLDLRALTHGIQAAQRPSMAPAIRVLQEYDRTGRIPS